MGWRREVSLRLALEALLCELLGRVRTTDPSETSPCSLFSAAVDFASTVQVLRHRSSSPFTAVHVLNHLRWKKNKLSNHTPSTRFISMTEPQSINSTSLACYCMKNDKIRTANDTSGITRNAAWRNLHPPHVPPHRHSNLQVAETPGGRRSNPRFDRAARERISTYTRAHYRCE